MMRRMLLAAMLVCLLAGLSQAKIINQSQGVVPQSDWSGLDQDPTIARHDPIDGGIPTGFDPEGYPKFDYTHEPDMPPTFMRHDPIDTSWPQISDPIMKGMWMLMKSFGGGL